MKKPAIALTSLVALAAIQPTARAAFSEAGVGSAAAATRRSFDLQHCRLQLSLDPGSHRLEGTAELTVAATGLEAGPFRMELHPDLTIEEVRRGGETVAVARVEVEMPHNKAGEVGGGNQAAGEEAAAKEERTSDGPGGDDPGDQDGEEPAAAVYELAWQPGLEGGTVTVRYSGRLAEDVLAGERPGQIHNFTVEAHIGPEGVFLSEEVPWYPRPSTRPSTPGGSEERELDLAHFQLTARAVPGMLLVASGNRQAAALDQPRGGSTTWESPFPLPGLTLVGGPHEAHRRRVGDVLVSAHLLPDSAPFAAGLLDAVEHYLELYVPLLGSYPYRELTVVENFFSSGFAMPGFTVLASPVIRMGQRSLRPGYVDHELLHNWWGNSVFVSPSGGNWAEGLTSYTTNYMRRVLEGGSEEARAYRRDTTHSLSRLTTEQDEPLATFGHDDGAGRLIGYQKGAMVFVQLAERLGPATVWRALARFYRDNKGRAVGWDEIQAAMEAETGGSLDAFFDFWVRRSGLPEITLRDAVYETSTKRLRVTAHRSTDDGLPLQVPLTLMEEGTETERTLIIDGQEVTETWEMASPPQELILDPDYRVLRKVPAELLMPSLSGIRRSKPLTIVRAEEDLPGYEKALPALEVRFEEDADGEAQISTVPAASFTAGDVAQGHALILGKAVRTDAASDLLRAGPLDIEEGRFRVGARHFTEPDQAVLCCLRNQRDPGGVLCVYYANSEAALERASLLSFYGGNSLIVFEAGRPILRQDFDRTESVEVTRIPPGE